MRFRACCLVAVFSGCGFVAVSLSANGTPVEQIREHVFVPSDARRHGEVRLCVSPGTVAVESVLFSSSLRRGVQAIAKKERSAFPEGSEGHPESRKYLEALERTADRILAGNQEEPIDPNAPVIGGAVVYRMLIRIEIAPAGTRYVLGSATFDVPEGMGPVALESVDILETVPVSRAFALVSMQNMLAAAHRESDEKAAARIAAAMLQAGLTKD